MNLLTTKKMTYSVNTVILLLVFGLMAFFHMVDAPFLTYFSIPTACVYLFGYYLIHKELLNVYVWMVYLWLSIYMSVTTVALGYGYGFHLYCFSMIPVMFVTEYMAYQLERRSLKAVYVSLGIACLYLLCTGYVALFGPVYERDQKYAAFFWMFNALIVFGFLIFYTNYMLKLVIGSQGKLQDMAQRDQLTKLYNRHYVISRLEEVPEEAELFLAMADIDDFKKINDKYGHNAGDEVLRTAAERMNEVCDGCVISRWGGEEFVIFEDLDGQGGPEKDGINSKNGSADADALLRGSQIMERLRKQIEEEPVTYDGMQIKLTITVGVSKRKKGQSIDAWISDADQNLYYGKNHGKNMVVSDGMF